MRRGVMLALGSAILFGMSTPLAKALLASVPPVMLAGLLYAGSGLGLGVVLAVRRLLRPSTASPVVSPGLPAARDWPWLAGAILVGGIAGPIALVLGLTTSAASSASLLLNLEAVFTALLAWFVFRENFDRRIAAGMLAIVAGCALLAWEPGARIEVSRGAALIALACLCWAVDNNLTRKVSGADALMIAAIKGAVAGVVNLAIAWTMTPTLPAIHALALAAVLGFLGYGLSLVAFVLALRALGTARTGAYFAVAPYFGALLAVLVQEDPVTLRLVGAGALMAAGVWLHLTERHEHRHEHERLQHVHAHGHDEHHRHAHADWDGHEPHAYPHVHEPMVHAHVHYPDLHHRHRH